MRREDKCILGWVANALLVSVMVGNPCADAQARYERMVDPQPGDLIFETTTLHLLLRDLDDDRWDGQFVRLEGIGTWYSERPGHEAAEEDAYMCRTEDGKEFMWTSDLTGRHGPCVYSIPDGPGWAIPIGMIHDH